MIYVQTIYVFILLLCLCRQQNIRACYVIHCEALFQMVTLGPMVLLYGGAVISRCVFKIFVAGERDGRGIGL